MNALSNLSSVVAATIAAVAPVTAPTDGYDWPLAPEPTVVRPFDPPAQTWGRGHRGVDLLGRPGQDVLAPGAGTVTHSGVIAGRGTVSVTHANGWRTTYEPVSDRLPRGTRVAAGQRLGSLDAGHCAPRTCLHWGLVIGDRVYRDPLTLVERRRVILLPAA